MRCSVSSTDSSETSCYDVSQKGTSDDIDQLAVPFRRTLRDV